MLLCLACAKEFAANDPRIDDDSHPHYGGCPECGDNGIPADTDERVEISITWHELRILVMWAEFWASKHAETTPSMQRVVYGIADRIQMQHMERGPSLTFGGELAELRGAFGDDRIEVHGFNEAPILNSD